MTCSRFVLSILVPPLAVLERGCGVVFLVFVLWIFFAVPGIAAALLINLLAGPPPARLVTVPTTLSDDYDKPKNDFAEEKRKRAILRLSDGAEAQVVEDDGAFPGADEDDPKRKRGG
jgi:uncharacterized membrane protein YqaE (UPF0057 family)